ncbi:diphthamide synthesis protein [Candidatus Woesearchaeota archaeon]|nr:diphthamide synthesis protein [Candidatus Woesearchaeota archaeon]
MYDLEINRLKEEIRKRNAKRVLLQLPDGLKPKAKEIVDELQKYSAVEVFVWLGSCYGGCDIPDVKALGVDLIVQYGHSIFHKEEW